MYWVFDGCDNVLQSRHLIGLAALEKRETGPLNQAPSLELEHLLRLRELLEHGANDIVIALVQELSFDRACSVHARARWSDFRYVHRVKYDGYKRHIGHLHQGAKNELCRTEVLCGCIE